MPASPEVREAELDDLKVVRFRRDILCRAGYEWEDAKMIARRMSVDLHEAVKLVEQGCPSLTARRIVL
jgi:uncharacterized protein (DUF111 family)